MRRSLSLALFFAVAVSSAAVQAQDANLKAALYDIQRAESQMPSLTPSRKANIVRMQRSLSSTEQRLQASPDKSSPAWQDANTRLEKLKQALAALASGGAPAAAPPPAAPSPAAPARQAAPVQPAPAAPAAKAAADPAIDRAMREMDALERHMRGQRVDQRMAMQNLTELYRIGKGLAAADRSNAAWPPAKAKYDVLNTQILDVNVQLFDLRLKKIEAQIGNLKPMDYMQANQVDPIRKMLADLYGEVTNIAAPTHPGLASTKGAIEKTNDAFEAKVKTAVAARGQHGDVDGKLAEIKKRVYEIKVPELNSYPQTQEQITAYAAGLEAVRRHIAEDGAWLAGIDGKVPLTVDQGNVFRHAKSEIQVSKPKAIDRSLAIATQTMDRWAEDQNRLLDFYGKIDPKSSNDRANKLLGQGKYDEGLKTLTTVKTAVETVVFYDKAVKRANAPDRGAQLARIDKAIADYKSKFQVALDTIRMPEAKSADGTLHKAVAEVFSRSKYGYKAERVVINAPLKSYEKETGDISRSSITTATITVYKYKWDQFQATTAEKVGDDYYLFYNTFKFYHAADPTTPTQAWILSDRFQSSRILKENIAK
jgi:hypothetical protein